MKELSDMDTIRLLIEHDEKVTNDFFYVRCRNLFMSIIRNIFSSPVDIEECINELYVYLMENDAARLKQFEGRSTLLQWLKITAIRYFIRNKIIIIENKSNEAEMPIKDNVEEPYDRASARMDIERLFEMMGNDRYVYVLRRIMLEEASPEDVADELNVQVANIYNIKKRAMTRLTNVALNDKRRYGRRYQ